MTAPQDTTERPHGTDPSTPEPVTVKIGAGVSVTRPSHAPWAATGKAAILLAMVGLEGAVDRLRLAQWLWPGSPQAQARNNLRVLVHRLHQRFSTELMVSGEQLALDPAQARVVLHDTEALLAALQTGGAARCELLADADVGGDAGEELQSWLDGASQRWRRLQHTALCQALAQAQAGAQHERAVALARACVQLEPLSEQWHRQLMDTLARSGDRAAALAAYEDCKTLLRQQLGVLPDVLTRTVQLRILQDQALRLTASPVAKAPEADGLTPLGGAARYPLIGRETVLAEVQAALAQRRHVVLQGEPGVGKTRLLRQLASVGADGVEQVALRLGLRDEPYAAVAQLLQEVQPRRAPRIDVPEQTELARLAPSAFPGVQASEARFSVQRLHAALLHWVQRLHPAGVQRLVLDDVHNADTASQAAFGALVAADDGAEPSPLLLLAHRSAEIDAPLATALVAAQASHRIQCIALQRLTLSGVRALLHAMDVPQRGAADTLPEQLLQRTGGNPLFVIELAQASGANPSGADDLQALLRARLAGCSAPAQQLAAVAAVAAADFSVELATAVIQQPALALMPAWQELQQRALFADHGLAHDLVRDTVLGVTPAAIAKLLHGQTARHLQAQGQQGAVVLRHWLAADEPDQALPHAAHQLYVTSASGRDTSAVKLALLAVLERVSDAVLLDKLGLIAQMSFGDTNYLPSDVGSRRSALVDKVERLAMGNAESRLWIQLTRASIALFSGRGASAKLYAEFTEAVQGFPADGLVRALAECVLAVMCGGLALPRLQLWQQYKRAFAAIEALPPSPQRTMLSDNFRFFFGQADDLPLIEKYCNVRRAWRVFRRQRDDASMSELLSCATYSLFERGADRILARVFDAITRSSAGQPHDWLGVCNPVFSGVAALNSGRFDIAWACFDRPPGLEDEAPYTVALAVTARRLGQWARVRSLMKGFDADQIRHHWGLLRAYSHVRAELDLLDGLDPVPGLRQVLSAAETHGYTGQALQRFAFAVARHTCPVEERKAQSWALIEATRAVRASNATLRGCELDCGEVLIEAGDERGLALVREAARAFRRGRTVLADYVPEALLRCARLLQPTDPAEAAALLHVARRWVLQALPHVPEFARQSFVEDMAVNRELLRGHPAVDTASATGRDAQRRPLADCGTL